MEMTEKAKEKIEDATKEVKGVVEDLRADVIKLTDKVKEKLKGTGEDLKESTEELAREVMKLTEKVKNMMPQKTKKEERMPVKTERQDIKPYRAEEHPALELERATRSLFDDFFREFNMLNKRWGQPWFPREPFFRAEWPRVDFTENDDAITMSVELPGVEKDDLQIDVTDNMISIRGEKRKEEEKKGRHYHRVERSYGSFQRSFTLPAEVDKEKTEAKFKDGVLSITLPKTPAAKEKVKKITVK